jgi:hypothetical protein
MATTVQELFYKFDILDFKQVKWGTVFNEKKQGVYIVSTSNDPNRHLGIKKQPEFDDKQIDHWLNKVTNFQIDGFCANASTL